MRTFIWVMFISNCISFLARTVLLCAATYPRQPEKVSQASDTIFPMDTIAAESVAQLIFTSAFLVWAAYLLFIA